MRYPSSFMIYFVESHIVYSVKDVFKAFTNPSLK